MHVVTTFWSNEEHTFDRLFFINNHGNQILFSADLKDLFSTFLFFQSVARFVKTPVARRSDLDSTPDCFQFAVMYEGEIMPVKWFGIYIGDDYFFHDIAFWTTLLKKNGIAQPFGKFPMRKWEEGEHTARYREFNIKARVYKYLANRVRALMW